MIRFLWFSTPPTKDLSFFVTDFKSNIHIQILQTDLHAFPWRTTWENLFKHQRIFFLLGVHFINSHNHFSWLSLVIVKRKLILVTSLTFRVKSNYFILTLLVNVIILGWHLMPAWERAILAKSQTLDVAKRTINFDLLILDFYLLLNVRVKSYLSYRCFWVCFFVCTAILYLIYSLT